MTKTRVTKTSTKLSLLVITFVLPVMISWILFYYHDHFHLKTTNHGNLISPSIQTQDLFQDKNSHLWQIVYTPQHCVADECDKMLFTLSQLRKALGKDYDRVGLVLMTKTAFKPQKNSDFRKLVITQQQYQQLLSQVEKTLPNKSDANKNKVYLVDPAGNLFMLYTETANPMDILKDLKHLLKVSQIG